MSGAKPAAGASQALAAFDKRPFFARALDHGLKNGLIDSEKLEAMRNEGAKGVVQIADYFGTAHLRTDLEEAVRRMVYLISLYLEHVCDGSLGRAARSLQENTFLSHSRGGSQMLKNLHAMPGDTIIDEPDGSDDVREFLRQRTLTDQWSVAEYRERLSERRTCKAQIDAALWLSDSMDLPRTVLTGETAESVLHACLMTRIANRENPGLLSATELKAFLKSWRRARKKRALRAEIVEDMPEGLRAVAESHLARIVAKDLPHIADTKVALDDLVREYHDRFNHFSLSTEVSDYDTLVTDEWLKVTRGKTDTDSMNTVFLCLAASKPPKPAITTTEARAAIRAIRKDGAAAARVPEFIRRSAPHQMIDDLIFLWEDEFFPEMIQQLILEDIDGAVDPVVRILAEHCHITSPARKR